MPTITFNGESFAVDHAAKGADYIHGYDANGVVIVSFDGIKDFSGYSYDGTYMNPSDCLAEQCNVAAYCGGVLKTSGGASIPASAIGLGNVNNTSDANKPVSTAQATAIAEAKAAGTTAQTNLNSHTGNTTVHITAAERTTWNGKANGTHTHTKSQITDFPSSMPASDVYSWAKASSKPTYTASEVGARPNTWMPSAADVGAMAASALATGTYTGNGGSLTINTGTSRGVAFVFCAASGKGGLVWSYGGVTLDGSTSAPAVGAVNHKVACRSYNNIVLNTDSVYFNASGQSYSYTVL